MAQNYNSSIGSIISANDSMADRIAASRAAAIQQQQAKIKEIQDPADLIGSEFVRGGLEKIGKAAAQKTGFQSFARLSNNIKTKGFSGGLAQTINDLKTEAAKKGRVLAQSEIDNLTEKAQSLYTKTKGVANESYLAGKQKVFDNINQSLKNKGYTPLDPEDVKLPTADIQRKAIGKMRAAVKDTADKIKINQGVDRAEGEPYQPASIAGDVESSVGKLSGQTRSFIKNARVVDPALIKSLQEKKLTLDQELSKAKAAIGQELDPITGNPIIKKPISLPFIPPDIVDPITGKVLEDEETRILKKRIEERSQALALGDTSFKDAAEDFGGRSPKEPITNVAKKLDDLPGKNAVVLPTAQPGTVDNQTIREINDEPLDSSGPAVLSDDVKKAPSVIIPKKQIIEPDHLSVPPASADDLEKKIAQRDGALEGRINSLAANDPLRNKIVDAYEKAGYEYQTGKLAKGDLRNKALLNNYSNKLQSVKDNAPELLDDSVYEGATHSQYVKAATAKEAVINNSIDKLPGEISGNLITGVKDNAEFTSSKDMSALKKAAAAETTPGPASAAYRQARNTNQRIAQDALASPPPPPPPPTPEPEPSAPEPPTPEPPTPEPTAPEPSVSAKTIEAAKDTETVAKDTETAVTTGEEVAEAAADPLAGAAELAIGIGSMLLPSLFGSDSDESKPPPTVSLSSTFTGGQGR
jgi:hypothetical protein